MEKEKRGFIRSKLGLERRSTLKPCVNQIILAFVTLLFFGSTLSFIFMAIKLRLGSTSFSLMPAECEVMKITMTGNTSCFYKPPMEEGRRITFPCLRVCVKVTATSQQPNNQSQHPPQQPDHSTTARNDDNFKLLLQSDTKIYGDDHRRRPCSYLPEECVDDEDVLRGQVNDFADKLRNKTKPCYDVVSSSSDLDDFAVSSTQSNLRLLLMAFLPPVAGALSSLLFCCEFWRRNYKHVSRLYVYNSWSAS